MRTRPVRGRSARDMARGHAPGRGAYQGTISYVVEARPCSGAHSGARALTRGCLPPLRLAVAPEGGSVPTRAKRRRLALLALTGPRRRRPGPSMARRGLRLVGPLSGSAGGAIRQGRGRVAVRGRREQGRGRDGARVLAVPLAPHVHLRGRHAHLKPEGAEEVLVARGHGRRVGGYLVGLGLGVGGKG